MEAFILEMKEKIIETLGLTDVGPGDIPVDGPLVGSDLGLDSIDVLELVMMIEKDYGVKIVSKEVGVRVFATLRTLAEYIDEHRREKVQ